MVTEVMKMREEEKKQSSQWKNFFKKRWVFPAVYLAIGALLISGIVWYQMSGNQTAEEPNVTENNEATGSHDEPAIEVNQSFENIAMPVENPDEVSVVTEFFDSNASAEDQEKALIVDGNTYRPNLGIDIAKNDGSEFDVVAALSGTVADVRQDALLGNVIELEHEDGVVTIYQSVKDIQVKAGDSVQQGKKLATSSTSQLNKEAKNHVHFEIRKNSQALNPLSYFGQPLTTLAEAQSEDAKMEETNNMQHEEEMIEETTDSEQPEESTTDANDSEEVKDTQSSESDTEQ